MISRFLRKAKPIKLGRWAVTNDVKVQEQRINWANHDHCGSEICEKKFTEKNKEVENWDEYLKNKKQKKEKEKTVNMKSFDEMLPFCI
tara:strand:- start:30334 stop:30597 length:264 start_codon:yes stop_codon:yes gene_type:complete